MRIFYVFFLLHLTQRCVKTPSFMTCAALHCFYHFSLVMWATIGTQSVVPKDPTEDAKMRLLLRLPHTHCHKLTPGDWRSCYWERCDTLILLPVCLSPLWKLEMASHEVFSFPAREAVIVLENRMQIIAE